MRVSQTALNRLARLEAARPVEYEPPSPWLIVMHQLIAFHLGGWRADGHRSPAECYGRATGWITDENPQAFEMERAMGTDEYVARHHASVAKMFAARGVDFERDGADVVWPAFVALMGEAAAGGMPFPEIPAPKAACTENPREK